MQQMYASQKSKEMLEYNANVRFIEFGLGRNAKTSIFFLE